MQSAPRALGPLEVEYPEPFTGIDGLRELSDGRVIVIDTKEKTAKLVDFAAGTATQVGRNGSGPGEYQMPIKLYPLPGDRSALLDMTQYMRYTVIGPHGAPDGLLSLVDSGVSARPFPTTGIDETGRFYGPVFPARTRSGDLVSDSGAIIRWDRAQHRRDTVAVFDNRYRSPLGSVARGQTVPFALRDQWAVAPDGRVAVVSFDPYRVTLTNANGVRIRGPEIPVEPIKVTDAHKQAWLAEQRRPIPVLALSRTGPNVARMATRRVEEPKEWPATLPPFLDNALSYAPNGMLWVHRTTPDPGDDPLYDVINQGGQRAFQVHLPAGTVLVGFGAKSVYLARVDEDDLHYLQRYALPR